jgi:hypothetical protein
VPWPPDYDPEVVAEAVNFITLEESSRRAGRKVLSLEADGIEITDVIEVEIDIEDTIEVKNEDSEETELIDEDLDD